MITIYYSTALFILTLLVIRRSHNAHDFRNKWRSLLKNSPEGLAAFYNLVPSYNAMVFKFWKPLRDRYWIPPAIMAEKYMTEMDADTRKKTMEWIKKGGKV